MQRSLLSYFTGCSVFEHHIKARTLNHLHFERGKVMTMDVNTLVAVSLMLAVFSAVAAVGTSIVLGAGFERLRTGFEVVRKQTGFFSDAIHKLEQKVEVVDEQTGKFSESISMLETKVSAVGDQANIFSECISTIEEKVDVVDKQTGFFSDAIQSLEKKIDTISGHEEIVAEKMKEGAENDLISTGRAEALVSHAEDLLLQVGSLAANIQEKTESLSSPHDSMEGSVTMPMGIDAGFSANEEGREIRFH